MNSPRPPRCLSREWPVYMLTLCLRVSSVSPPHPPLTHDPRAALPPPCNPASSRLDPLLVTRRYRVISLLTTRSDYSLILRHTRGRETTSHVCMCVLCAFSAVKVKFMKEKYVCTSWYIRKRQRRKSWVPNEIQYWYQKEERK